MPGKRIKWTEDKISFIVQKYTNQEMNTYELANYFNCSNDTISRRLKEQGIIPHKFYEDLSGQKFGKLTVLQKSSKSNRRLYWDCICECGKIITVKGDHLRQKNQLSCGCLSSKGEEIIAKILQDNDIMFITQYKFENFCSDYNNIPYRFDFAIFKNNILSYLIEFDGEQHYIEAPFFNKTLKEQQEIDKEKTEFAKNKNIKLIRIPYWKRNTLNLQDLEID